MEIPLHQMELVAMAKQFFSVKGLVMPDAQDSATFTAQEAMELVDCFLREKTYKRNHEKIVDGRGKEAAQTLMMLLLTCDIAQIDLLAEYIKLTEVK